MGGEFAAIFVALWVGHSVGDHWVQTSCQSIDKGLGNPMQPGPVDKKAARRGQLACLRHVASLTATKAVCVAVVVLAFHVKLTPWAVALGFLLDALSHYWADRRWTLEELARLLGKTEFYRLGTDTVHQSAPPGSHIGTGKYALDQSWHHAWLFIAALVIVA